jgi:hypothetical protein
MCERLRSKCVRACINAEAKNEERIMGIGAFYIFECILLTQLPVHVCE